MLTLLGLGWKWALCPSHYVSWFSGVMISGASVYMVSLCMHRVERSCSTSNWSKKDYRTLRRRREKKKKQKNQQPDLKASSYAPGGERCVETNAQMNQLQSWGEDSVYLGFPGFVCSSALSCFSFPPSACPSRQSSNSKKLGIQASPRWLYLSCRTEQNSDQKRQFRYRVSCTDYPRGVLRCFPAILWFIENDVLYY